MLVTHICMLVILFCTLEYSIHFPLPLEIVALPQTHVLSKFLILVPNYEVKDNFYIQFLLLKMFLAVFFSLSRKEHHLDGPKKHVSFTSFREACSLLAPSLWCIFLSVNIIVVYRGVSVLLGCSCIIVIHCCTQLLS